MSSEVNTVIWDIIPDTPRQALQRAAFLAEFPLGSPEVRDVLG